MADIELIGVPFDGYGRHGNQARAAQALNDAGLRDAFDHHHVVEARRSPSRRTPIRHAARRPA